MKNNKTHQQGFTLIEVLIAIVIFAIGVLSLITMQTTSIKGNLNSNNISVASGWAADKIEQIFAMDYDDNALRDDEKIDDIPPVGATDGSGGLNDITDATADGKAVSPDGFYTIYWNVADDNIMPNTKTIRIIVLRKDMGVTKSVTMDYLKAKYM